MIESGTTLGVGCIGRYPERDERRQQVDVSGCGRLHKHLFGFSDSHARGKKKTQQLRCAGWSEFAWNAASFDGATVDGSAPVQKLTHDLHAGAIVRPFHAVEALS